MVFKLGEFIASSKRIFYISRKPSWKDYVEMSKVTGLGIILIAIIGFAITFVFKFFGLGA